MASLFIVSTMHDSPWGGSEELWSQMAADALQRGHHVNALLPKWDPQPNKVRLLKEKGLKVFEWAEKGSSPTLNSQRGLPALFPFNTLFDYKVDAILISHGGMLDVCYGLELLALGLINSSLDYNLVIQCNTELVFPTHEQRTLLRAYFQRAKRIFFVSRHNWKVAEKLLAIKLPNASIINNPVNLDNYAAVPWPRSSNNEATARFGCVARLDSHAKGFDVMFEALAGNSWKNRKWQLEVYGSGRDQLYLQDLIKHFELQSKIRLMGTSHDIREVWSRNELLILASRYEGTPLALYEAMLCGRGAVVTDVGGNSDWISDGVSGFVAEAPVASLFETALERAWQRRNNWQQMGQSARDFFLANHEITSGRTLLEALLSDVVSESTSTHEAINVIREAPRISVIIPCYNYASYLEQAVHSIVNQTLKNFEIIIVNDGSTDNSLEVASKLKDRLPSVPILVVDQDNAGQPAAARNTGIAHAQGEYIICLDADDTFANTMLADTINVFQADQEVQLVYTDALYVHEDGHQEIKEAGRFSVNDLKIANQFSYSAMYTKRLWEQLGGYRLNVKGYEDWDFWLAAALTGAKAAHVKKPLLIYNFKEGLWRDALKRDQILRANLVINNQEAFAREQIAAARAILSQYVQKRGEH